MKGKRILSALAAAMLLASTVMLSGASAVSSADEPAETAQTVVVAKNSKPDYSYLRGTMYKSLYASRYENLYKTTIKPETNSGTAEGGAGAYGGIAIGSAANPGYSGGSGTYSLSNYTVAAHLTVMGTSIQDRAVWQGKKTSDYTNSSVTWAAGTANLRSGELSQNTVIYGHNWGNCFVPFKKTGSEFESLMALTYEDVVSENQYIYLTTNSGTHTFRIFAVSFTKNLSFYINCNNVDVASIAATAKSMSLYDFGVDVGSTDKIITLSTCTRYFGKSVGANQRFIVMGVLVD